MKILLALSLGIGFFGGSSAFAHSDRWWLEYCKVYSYDPGCRRFGYPPAYPEIAGKELRLPFQDPAPSFLPVSSR